MDELEVLSKPIVEYLRKNYNPHVVIVITYDNVLVSENTMSIPIKLSDSAVTVNFV